MGILDYFRAVETVTPEQVRNLMNTHSSKEYNLVDVRQPREYEREHLPGAILMPMAELMDRQHELDPKKPTITY